MSDIDEIPISSPPVTKDSDIDEVPISKGQSPSSPQWVNTAIQRGVRMALPSSSYNQPINSPNPIMAAAQTLRDPTRIASTMSQPGQIAGNTLEDVLRAQGVHPAIAKLLGAGTSMAMDPSTYAMGGTVGKELPDVVEGATNLARDKVIAPGAQILSAVPQRYTKALFNNPSDIVNAASSKESGGLLGAVYRGLNNGAGLSEDEMRLIAKAGDRGTGGSQAVYDQVLDKIKDVQKVAQLTQAGQEIPQELADAKFPTMGELIAGRRAASKLSTVRKGMEGYQTVKDLNLFEDAMRTLDPEGTTKTLAALSDVAKSKTKEAFMNIFPQNKNMSANALRGVGMLALGRLHPALALAGAPATSGIATLLASGLARGAKAVASSPIAQYTVPELMKNSLQTVQQ